MRFHHRRISAAIVRVFALILGLSAMSAFAAVVKPVFIFDTATVAASKRAVPREDRAESVRRVIGSVGVAVVGADALFAANPGDPFEMTVPDRPASMFRTHAILVANNGGRTWVGISNDGATERRAFVSDYEGKITGLIETDQTLIELLPFDDTTAHVAHVIDQEKLGATRFFTTKPDFVIPPPLESRPLWMQEEARAAKAADAERTDRKAAPSPQSTIDVMVAYTPGMVSRYGSAAGVVSRINTLVAHANTAYTNSDVGITLRLVHTVQVSYSESGDNSVALDVLTNGTGALSGIAALRNTYGADLVSLIRPFESATHNGCGYAWIGGYNVSDIGNDGPYGFSTVGDGNDVNSSGFFCPIGSFAHELGHNMGLMHDRANSGGDIGATAYAYGFINANSTGDIMSYAQSRGIAFASPNVRCTGTSCSVGASGTALGIAANTPVESCLSSGSGCAPAQASTCSSNPSSCADAARALNFTRVKVSQYRASVSSSSPSIAGVATLNGGGNVNQGTQLCFNGSSAVSACTVGANGQFNCTVPSGWTGTVHLQAGNSRRVAAKRYTTAITGANIAQDFTVYDANDYSCNLDIDNNGLNEAAIDGAMILRKLIGLTGISQAVSSSGVCAQRTTDNLQASFLDAQNYDIGGGAHAFRDGLILARLMRVNASGQQVVQGSQAVNETGLTWSSVQSNISGQCGVSFQ